MHRRSLVRSYLAELRSEGLLEQVTAALPERARATLSLGREMPQWVESALVDEVFAAVANLKGREAVRLLGRNAMMKRSLGTTVAPVVSFVLEFIGADPGSLFSRAESMTSLVTQGLRIVWTRKDHGGELEFRACEPPLDIYWAVWEGTLETAFALTRTEGVVHGPRCEPDRRTCRFDVTWR